MAYGYRFSWWKISNFKNLEDYILFKYAKHVMWEPICEENVVLLRWITLQFCKLQMNRFATLCFYYFSTFYMMHNKTWDIC